MNPITCLYPDRDAVLVACLYDDIDAAERVAFETHVTTCLPCRSELAELCGVRATLGEWAPPEPARTSFLNIESRIPNPRSRRPAAWWHTVPVWAQLAAAMVVLGVSASIANLDVRYDRNGLSVRTGWSKPVPAPAAPAQVEKTDAAPWRAEIAALQNQLRSDMRAQATTVAAASTTPAAMPDAEFGRRVRVLLDESEKRQQNELALRVGQLQRDVYAQQQADLVKVNQNIGLIQSTYGNTYGDLRNYVLKVAQRQ